MDDENGDRYRLPRQVSELGMAEILSEAVAGTKYLIPKNEMEVMYLFSRNHEKLGFEHILSFQQFPDCWAIRDGKKVGIEIEFMASNFFYNFQDSKSNGLAI